MISMLVISKQKETREHYAADFCNNLHIDSFDQTIYQPESSLGIEDVREIQKKALFKPLKSKEKAVIIHDAHLATTEAQNALLKLLEEPPQNTYIILTASSTRSFLPTILSRCKIIQLDTETTVPEDEKEQEKIIDSLLAASIGEKLVFAQNVSKEKDEALPKLESLVHAAHTLMQKYPENIAYARLTQTLATTYAKAANTNINLRFLLEHALLSQSGNEEDTL